MEVIKKHLSGIKIQGESGMKGLHVTFSHQEVIDGKTWNIDDLQKRKMPVGENLDKVIKAFRYYLLDACGYDMEDMNVAEATIKEISFGGGVRIMGSRKILNGTKMLKLDTKEIDESHEYEKMEELRNLVGQLKAEIDIYMDGKSVVSEKQFVLNFYKDKKGFDEAEYAGMSEVDLKAKYTEALEKMGSIVIHNEDMSSSVGGEIVEVTETISMSEMIEEAEALSISSSNSTAIVALEGNIINNGDIHPNFDGAKEVGQPIQSSPIVVEEDEDNLVLAISPVKAM